MGQTSKATDTRNRSGMSRLQRKGLMTLNLLIIAESVAVTNAVTFWSTYNKWSQQYGRGRSRRDDAEFENKNSPFAQAAEAARECSAKKPVTTASPSDGGACSAHPSLPPAVRRSRLAKRITTFRRHATDEECCSDCSDCMSPSDALARCQIIRGGHSPGEARTAVDAAADAAAVTAATPTPYGIPLNGWKVIFQAFLTAMNVLCWLIPLRSKKISDNKLALSLANAFSGGVFLTLAFGHLIPECVHGFHGHNEALPYMIVLGGYLLIFFVEKVAFDPHGAMHQMEEAGKTAQNGEARRLPKTGGKSEEEEAVVVGGGGGRGAVILLGALAVHSILEMTALGLANTFGDSALLTLSIALHQPAESIALLVAFLKSGMPKGQIIQYLSVFSAMGPIGVAIGMAVSEFASPFTDAVMLAVVAGTFIYVGATEVIPEEWEEQEHKWKKFSALISGIVSIFMITQYTMTLEGQAS